MKSNNFSSDRFLAYFRLFGSLSMRQYLLTLSSIFIVTFLFFLFNFYVNSMHVYSIYGASSDTDFSWKAECSMMTFLIYIIAMIGGSRVFESLSTRRQRINVLEIPASQSEKFFTWFIAYLPILLLASFACFYLADIARVIWIKSFTSFGDAAHIIPIRNLLALTTNLDNGANSTFDIVFCYGNLLILHSLFALGGIIFSRFSFLKTFFSLFIIMMVLGLISVWGYHLFYPHGSVNVRFDLDSDQLSTSIVYAAISLAVACYFYCISFFRLKESEIIDRW